MFIANLKYKKPMEEVNKALEAHLEYLDKYFEKGKFICTGKKSFPELGGVILFNSNNLEEAKKILNDKPGNIKNQQKRQIKKLKVMTLTISFQQDKQEEEQIFQQKELQ